jgi:hypothetical protein
MSAPEFVNCSWLRYRRRGQMMTCGSSMSSYAVMMSTRVGRCVLPGGAVVEPYLRAGFGARRMLESGGVTTVLYQDEVSARALLAS